MTGKRYKAHRDNVIDLFERYKEKRGTFNDGVDIQFLEKRIDALKKDKFILSVAGEVKAGKSTFINALLGAEILPSGVLQETSAIVEIFKSETSYLRVKFADKKEKDIYDDPSTPDIYEAQEELSRICKINDVYREIPATLIDKYIIQSEGDLAVDNHFIRHLEEQSGAHLQDKQEIIKRYLSERTKDKIPVQIEFGYPLKWDFDELRIVDTPGVNAIGCVQDLSFSYFEEANAILFIHPIKPIESKSLREFVNNIISNRSKETLFLILTHAGLLTNNEVERLYTEAKRLYKDIIPEERIFVVDSLLKLIHSELKRGVSVKDIRKNEKKKKILSSYREQAEEEERDLIEVVLEASRFDKLLTAIDDFSMRAPNLQLQEILEKIKEGYENQEEQYTEKVRRLEKKKKDPQEFAEEIDRIKKALDDYKLLTNKVKEDLKAKYLGRQSKWQEDINQLKGKYPELITASDSIESVRKHLIDGLNEIREEIDKFSRELREELSNELKKVGKKFSEEHKISTPKVDLNALESKAKKNAYKDVDVYESRPVDFWDFITLGLDRMFRNDTVKTGTKKVFDKKRFLDAFKVGCNKEFYKIVNALPNKSKEVLDNYLDSFSKEMDSVIDERQKALEEEKEKKQLNEEIFEEIKQFDRKKKDIEPEKKLCIEILEDIR